MVTSPLQVWDRVTQGLLIERRRKIPISIKRPLLTANFTVDNEEILNVLVYFI